MRSARIGLRMRAPRWAILRSVLLVFTWLAFYASLPVLNLSVAAVAVYTNPIITALLSALLIGEPVTARRWVGVLLGFLGVVVILRPGSDAFSWYVLLPLLAAILYSLAMRLDVVLRVVVKLLLPFILVFGFFVQFHGEISPGGGFQAGVIVGAGLILYAIMNLRPSSAQSRKHRAEFCPGGQSCKAPLAAIPGSGLTNEFYENAGEAPARF